MGTIKSYIGLVDFANRVQERGVLIPDNVKMIVELNNEEFSKLFVKQSDAVQSTEVKFKVKGIPFTLRRAESDLTKFLELHETLGIKLQPQFIQTTDEKDCHIIVNVESYAHGDKVRAMRLTEGLVLQSMFTPEGQFISQSFSEDHPEADNCTEDENERVDEY